MADAKLQSWRTERGSANDRGYTWAWRKASKAFLASHPTCEYCDQRGEITPSTLVDHKIPHRGDQKLFWDKTNWAASCKPCHDGYKQRVERTGVVIGSDENGNPLDLKDPWFR